MATVSGPRKLAFTNQSGGAGKSTSTINVGAVCASFGLRTLIVDLDAQCDASVALGYEYRDGLEDQATIFEVLEGDAKMADAIVPAYAGPQEDENSKVIDNLHLVLGSDDMEAAEQILKDMTLREMWLRRALKSIEGDFDVVLIDTPGNLGLVVVNAIVASEEVIACVMPSYKELRALTRMEQKVQLLEDEFAEFGGGAKLTGVLILGVPTTRNQGAVWDDGRQLAQETYGDLVLPTVRRSPRIPEAYAAGSPLLQFDRAGEATSDYVKVTKALGFQRAKRR
ncbi:ParA family protein [Streptomyces fractus]|uniref:ParA family protein n=1 Tax=Streptomyces fractus TaxID=641806 RepID=UPI003CFAC078